MRRERFFAVAHAFAQHEGADQTGHGRVDVHDRAACEVQRAHLPQEARFAVHLVHHFGRAVGVWPHPEPHHVGNRRVAEGEPQCHESQHRRELHAFGKRADDQAASDSGKGGLESRVQQLRNVDTLAEGGRHRKFAGGRSEQSFHEQPVKAADVGIAFGKRQAVAVKHPQHHDHRKRDHDLHQHRQHVFAAHQTAVEQSQAGDGHHDDEQGRHKHPGVVAFVGHRC